MKNQFFYTRTVEDKTFTDSFNVNKVIRTVEVEQDKFLVVLDDFHERVEQVPDIDSKGKMRGFKRVRDTFQSEIHLTKEDAVRYKELMAI